MCAWRVRINGVAFVVYIPRVKQLVVRVSHLTASGQVALDVVEGADTGGEVDVLGICETCVAEDEDAILEDVKSERRFIKE